MRNSFAYINNPKSTFTPLLIAAITLFTGLWCRAGATPVSHKQLETLAQKVSAQSKVLSTQTPTTTQIKSLISVAQKYFSARATYQKVLYQSILQDDTSPLIVTLKSIELKPQTIAPTDHTPPFLSNKLLNSKLKTQNSKLLLPLFQKYFSSNSKLSLSDLAARRDLLRQIEALDNGHLSGAVWLYDSPLKSFALSHLDNINPRILKISLSRAKYLRGKHQYSAAQKLYQNLLKEYAQTFEAPRIKVLLMHSTVEGYNYQSDHNLKKHDYKKARTYLQKIIDAYPKTKYAAAAQKKLEGTVPVAVNYYKTIADKNFHPKGHIGVPQNKAASYYKRMYQEDPKGPKADYALYYWARALGSKGKVKQEVKLLQQHLKDFPDSKVRSKAMYLLGFVYCDHLMGDLKRGVPLLKKVAKEFPKSKQAPEALWNAAFVLGSNGHYQKAIPLLQQLKKQYPKSRRTKHADKWIKKYQEEL